MNRQYYLTLSAQNLVIISRHNFTNLVLANYESQTHEKTTPLTPVFRRC
jgi:hypothetical protein